MHFSGRGIYLLRCGVQNIQHVRNLNVTWNTNSTPQRPKKVGQAMFLWLNAHFEPFLHDGRVQLIGQSGLPPAKILNFL